MTEGKGEKEKWILIVSTLVDVDPREMCPWPELIAFRFAIGRVIRPSAPIQLLPSSCHLLLTIGRWYLVDGYNS